MIKKRIGNDFTLYLNVFRVNDKAGITEGVIPEGAIIEDLTNAKNIRVRLYNSNYGIYSTLTHVITINEIKLDIPSSIQNIGTHYIYLEYDKLNIELPDGLQHYAAEFSAFEIVSHSAMAEQEKDVYLIGSIRAGADGINGKSNYEIAQFNGFDGTEEDYIEWTRQPAVDAAARLIELTCAFNVTVAIPLQVGKYYDLASAVKAVPEENRKVGLKLTYLSALYEKDTLIVTAIPTTAGNITITLNGVVFTVAVDPSEDTTGTLVANKIRAAAFAGWTVSGTGATVIFTKNAVGVCSSPVFNAGTTGSTATIVTTVVGTAESFFEYQYNASSTTNWTTLSNWRRVANEVDINQIGADLNILSYTMQMSLKKIIFDNTISTTLFVNKNRINSLGQKEISDRWRLTNPIALNKGQTIYSYSADSGAGLNAIILTDASESFYTPIAPIMTSGYGVYKYTAINNCYVMLQSDGKNSQGVKYCGVIVSDGGIINDVESLNKQITSFSCILNQTSSDYSSISNAEFLASEQYNIDEFGYGTVNANWRKIDINLLTGQTVLLWGATGGGAASMISKSTEIVNRYTPLIVYHSNVSKWHRYTATEDITVTLCSQYTRNPYAIIAYDSQRIVDIENRLTNLESNDTSIFSFNPEKDVKIKLKNANLKYGLISSGSISRQRSPLTLCHFSDLHADSVNLARIIEFKQKYQTYINDILSTGDSVSNRFSDSFSFWASSGANNVLNTLGNHDAFDAGGVLRSQIDCYSKYFTPFIANWGVVQPSGASESGYCYYYKDYAQQGVRLIVLNDLHYDSIQETWLESVLTSAKNNSLAVIIAQHYQAGLANAVNCTFNSNDYNDKVVDLLTPPAEKVDNFIASGGEFVCWLSGHTHNDKFGTLVNYPLQVQIAVENAGCDSGWNDDARVLGTKSQDCFNVIAIDTYKKEIKLLRIGADYDRQLRHKGTLCYNYSTKTLISNS